ncbi:hydrogenase expression protein HypF [Streptomyces netropsis]|uniref:Uncharacterized protein n=1 Tax=Streptomyces netropsis TaxID=55404 RepID=A0A7W7L9N8_STRNE|nr:hydrogenase expression protein HypF [Streptomyces netropsis]MBB4885676.1 hypothetical protein [Streptomyces netropsis]
MATDDAHEEGTAPGPAGRSRTGPRHAAPRKPLLTRLHMPAGKAVALAAMPTAVLMGMGFTPQLAQAKPLPKNPFLDGPCVTAPDQTPSGTPSGTADASPRPEPSGSTKDAGEPDRATKPGKPSSSASPAAPRKRTAAPRTSPSATATPTPSASKSTNPLDPLGIGEKLGDILTGSKSDQGDKAAPVTPPSTSPSPSASKSAGPGKPVPPTGTPADKARPSKKATPTQDPTPSGSATSSPPPTPSTSASPDASEETPCPSRAVTDENEQHAFPIQPWYLETSKLSLHGLKYEGIKEITMVNGQRKKVLKFTASALDIKDLHQIVNSGGKQYHVTGMGKTSTIRDGKVTMYTEELKGTLNLLGIPTLKVTFSPETPPPLSLPELVFTDVKIRQAGQFGGTLAIPNLHQYLTDGTYP